MRRGLLEVLLVGAKGLVNTDYLCKMDPYVILTCRSQDQRSSIASGKGSDPQWNENFVFIINDSATELKLKIMDSDTTSRDDFVGEAIILLDPVFMGGQLPPTLYDVLKDQKLCGQIKVGLTFVPEDRSRCLKQENIGGLKQSSFD